MHAFAVGRSTLSDLRSIPWRDVTWLLLLLMLIDSHCHLDFPELRGQLDAVLGRAKDAGVGLMVTISTRVRKFGEILSLAERYETVFCSVGTHPHYASEEPDVTAEEIVRLARHPKVVAIGEAGLDYHYDNSSRSDQERSFRAHIAAARATQLPLVIHARDADSDIARILEEETREGEFPFILHCFTGGRELAERGLGLGGYISFSGVVTFKTSGPLRDIAQEVPLDRLLVETDAPYLAPEPLRGRTNEPANVVHTAALLARLRGLEFPDFSRATTANFARLFSKVPRAPFADAA